ncbi:MAG: S8 family serine peptidase [Bacteroidia bacterium]
MKHFYSISTIVFLCMSFSSFSQSAAWQLKIDPVVLQKLQTADKAEFVAILKEQANTTTPNSFTKEEKAVYVFKKLSETAKNTQDPIRSLLKNLKVEYQPFWIINAVSIVGDKNILNQVAQLESVSQIIENAKYVGETTVLNTTQNIGDSQSRGLEWGIKKTKADAVWALGYKGQGVVVAGEDTGYDWKHPAITKQYRGNGTTIDHNYNWHDCVHSGGGKCGADAKAPCDDQEHGTHTMGTMVGYDGGSNQIGMAPDAKWIGCRNMNVNNGKFSMYMEGFEWFLAPTDLSNQNPDPSKAPHVLNNSWGCPTSEGCNSSNFPAMETAVMNLRNSGIVVVVSAGNDGSQGCSSIHDGASNLTPSFTVGNTNVSDGISASSSRGPVTNYGPVKISPDISAPGSDIRSSIPGNGYKTMSGTSMAGPHVAGLVALIISANPSLAGNVDKIEDIIQQTAVKLKSSQNCGGFSGSDIPNNAFGYGRIDALAAVKMAMLTVSINNTSTLITNVVAYPNPFNEKITFEFTNCKSNSTLHIYSIAGQLIMSKTWEKPPLKYELDMSSLPSGAYFYKLENDSDNFKGKIFKVK